MSREFFYCSRCQTRLSSDDFHAAFEIKGQLVCDACVPEAIAPLSMKDQETILLQIKQMREAPPPPLPAPPRISTGSTSARLRPVTAPLAGRPTGIRPAVGASIRPGSATAIRTIPVARHSNPWGLIFFLGLVVLLLSFAGLFYFISPPPTVPMGPPQRPPTADVRPPAPPAPPRPTPDPSPPVKGADASAALAIEQARAVVREKPADLGAQVEAWRKALLVSDGSRHEEAARREYETVRAAHQKAVAAQLSDLDRQVQALASKEKFSEALALLESARAKHPLGDWMQGIDVRMRDLGANTWKVFTPVRDQALAAQKRGAQGEVDALKARVAAWGLASFVKELDRLLAAPPAETATPSPGKPEPAELKPLTPEAQAWRTAWDRALGPAALRDYAAARQALEAASKGLSGELREEGAKDLELLSLAEKALAEALQRVKAWPRGGRLKLLVLDEALEPAAVEETLLKADADALVLIRGGTRLRVEWEDVAARSLGQIYRDRPGAVEEDRRAAALLCLLEGDTDGARALLNGPPDQIPWKYWSRSSALAERRRDPNGKETAARKLYFAAESDHLSPRTRASAAGKYRTLLNEFADTDLVRSRRDRIAARRDSAKEFVFLADDVEAAGTLKLSRDPKAGPCYLSVADSPNSTGPNNYVEFQFYALPEMPYKAWVYVGACCQETFAFFLQATDLSVTDDATRQVLQAGPGGQAMVPVKHSIPFLKTRHEIHGGPKEPKRWEWIQLPLPAFTASGVKTVRIVTEQKGFAFAAAVASASRTREPGESDLKAWAAERAVVPDVPEAAPSEGRDPALVGHWTFDEPSGAAAFDASGHDHTAVLTGEPPRGPGKTGGALLLDAKDRYATIPSTAVLDRLQEGAYTISAWYRPNTRPEGKTPADNDSHHAIVMKTGIHEGLRYGHDLKFSMDHWLSDNTGAAAVSANAYPPGTFYHVAGVVNRLEGTVRLYVNGRLEGVHMWSPQLSPRDYGRASWKIGIGAPGASEYRWAADGAVDDVRLYSRALNAQEIRALAGGTALAALPSIDLTAPGAGETYAADSTITLAAEVGGLDKVQRVDFLLGTTVVASDASAPFTATWARVPAGVYTLVARATVDRNSPPLHSKPVTVRVGQVELFRAVNLGGVQAVSVDGVPFEPGSGAPNLAVNGQRLERRDVELDPPADSARATLVRSSLTYRDGAIVTLQKIPAGTYQIYLYVWEDNESATYDVVIEDKTLQSRYVSGPPGSWTKLGPWTLDVTDEGLTIGVRGGPANFSAVEVWKVTR